jgi:hypothetical protein
MKHSLHAGTNMAIGATLGLFLGLGTIIGNRAFFDWIATTSAPKMTIAVVVGISSLLVAAGYSISAALLSARER